MWQQCVIQSRSFNKNLPPANSLRESHIQVCALRRGLLLTFFFFVCFYYNILFIDLDQFSIIYRVLYLHSSPRNTMHSVQLVIRAQKYESLIFYKIKTAPQPINFMPFWSWFRIFSHFVATDMVSQLLKSGKQLFCLSFNLQINNRTS